MANELDIAQRLLQRRGAPASQDNLRTAMSFIAQNPQVAEALSMGLQKTVDDTNQTMEPSFALEAPSVGRSPISSQELPPAAAPQPTATPKAASTPRPQGAVARPTSGGNPTQSPFITTPVTPNKTASSGDDGIWPWLIAALGIRSTDVGGDKAPTPDKLPATPEHLRGGPRGSFVGPMTPQATAQLTDQSTRAIGGPKQITGPNAPMPLEGPKETPQIGFNNAPKSQAGKVTIPTPQEPGQIAGPKAMSMFSDKFTPEAGDALARKLQLAAEQGRLTGDARNTVWGLSNLIAAGPNEANLDMSRAAIEAIQKMPYAQQQFILKQLQGNPMFSPDFNAYLQPRVGARPGEILKKAVGKRG